jgi:DNA-directed RNA polymerase, beta subunit/140 kD subunit
MKTSDMMFSKEGISPDIILNPNAIPSRMTIGQLVECLLGKVAAISGFEADGTPFNNIDLNSIKDKLESLGYHRDGIEEMYNGMTGQKLRLQIFIGPTYYQRLKHLIIDKIHCLSWDTEILTQTGWKTVNSLTREDKVATLHNNTDLKYENPTEILRYENYKGQMYHIKNKQLDLYVTGNHRMYLHSGQNKYILIDSNKIINQKATYKRDANLDIPPYQFILNKTLDMTLWLKFIGLYYQENLSKTYGENSINIKTIVPNINEFIDVLSKLDFKFRANNNELEINDKELYEYLNDNIKLPQWVLKLNKEQSKLLILTLLNMKDGQDNVTTNVISKTLADYIQIMCLHAGWAATIEYDDVNKDYRLDIVTGNCHVTVNNGEDSKCQETIEYVECPVFCLQVPSEIFFVRLNGKVCWTGNSRSRGPRTILTRHPPEGRSRDGGLRLGEMERDAILAHGLSRFLKEKLLDTSDAYSTFVCDICGLFAQRLFRNVKDNKKYRSANDIFYCQACKNSNQISQIMIPYAFKLLIQELMSMNIVPRIRTNTNIYTS